MRASCTTRAVMPPRLSSREFECSRSGSVRRTPWGSIGSAWRATSFSLWPDIAIARRGKGAAGGWRSCTRNGWQGLSHVCSFREAAWRGAARILRWRRRRARRECLGFSCLYLLDRPVRAGNTDPAIGRSRARRINPDAFQLNPSLMEKSTSALIRSRAVSDQTGLRSRSVASFGLGDRVGGDPRLVSFAVGRIVLADLSRPAAHIFLMPVAGCETLR
ncbi:hypothetical protein SAMN04488026_103938 [Aliiruegeria lutimaris]|uniref:Uncharacterized protein n=1 Tax=Aliiruegeria lutimaris TaxID=571298 RepID=A0A1G9BFQ8_9RHOB|nr:hypothetical protein SAMN04488026_103938 [Aliiruegeria lutimaris]